MIKESEIVTKKYLTDTLRGLKTDIIREVKVMMHETMEGAMDNAKEYYTEETNRHMSVLQQGFRDEMRYYKDEMKTLMEKLDNHETRISNLELV